MRQATGAFLTCLVLSTIAEILIFVERYRPNAGNSTMKFHMDADSAILGRLLV